MTSLLESASPEEIALFNPAFLARVIRDSAGDYEGESGQGMPVALPFLVVPIVLHLPTRVELPGSASSQMQTWIREHPQNMSHLGSHVISLRGFVGFAIRFGLIHGVLRSQDGRLSAGPVKRRPPHFNDLESSEVRDCLRASRLVGRWFGRQPDPATLLAFWGLRP